MIPASGSTGRKGSSISAGEGGSVSGPVSTPSGARSGSTGY